MSLSRSKLEKNLPKKGFEKDSGRDHIYFHHYYDGEFTSIYTKISHSKKLHTISGGLLKTIQKQLKLNNKQQLQDLINCKMSEEAYNKYLTENSHI